MENPDAIGTVTGPTKEALLGTRGWVKLVGIMLYIGAGFTMLGMVAVIFGAGAMGGRSGAMPLVMMVVMCGFYLLFAAIYIFLGMYLLNYSSAIGRLLDDDQVANLEVALQAQQKFWRLAGILVWVMLVMAVVGIVVAIAIPMMMNR